MQVETQIRSMFSYSLLTICIITLIIAILFIILKLFKKKNIVETLIIPDHKDLVEIKKKYLLKIDNLIDEYNNKKITSRKSYQQLSSIIRNFIFETTNIKVQNYTLKDIESIDIPVLYELVSEYYDPEFAKISNGNILSSIDKTRMVIEKWK